jgi:hypothetical protein
LPQAAQPALFGFRSEIINHGGCFGRTNGKAFV